LWRQAETTRQTRRIRPSCLTDHLCCGDPQQRGALLLPHSCQPRQRQRETGDGAAIAHGLPVQLYKARLGQAAAKRCVEALDASWRDRQAQPEIASLRRLQPLGQTALNPGYGMTQGKKRLLRQGGFCHDGYAFDVCSCYVPMDSRGPIKSQDESEKNLFLFWRTLSPN
jgi:hypothetical protein